MRLQDIMTRGLTLTPEGIKRDRELTTQIQIRLITLRLLDPVADGNFGEQTRTALKDFQVLMGLPYDGNLNLLVAESLIETKQAVPLKLGSDLASRIIRYFQLKNYYFPVGSKRYSIVYVEGINPDGKLNDDSPNVFNDIRCVIEIPDGVPRFAGGPWVATTEAGRHYTEKPMNKSGCARIQFGQYPKAWTISVHGSGSGAHKALVQCGPITVCRDFDKNNSRIGDRTQTGIFGCNQHHSYGQPKNNIGRASAGCAVGLVIEEHFDFMDLISQDRRYLVSNDYKFGSTFIPGDDLAKKFPA